MQNAEQSLGWRGSLEEARGEARENGKLALIFLWHHNCGGSKTMDEVTYPDDAVRRYVEDHFVPVRFNVLEVPEMEDRFGSGWTPTLIVQDPEGHEHRRSQGYLDPRRFLGEMVLARLANAIYHRAFDAARERSGEALELTRNDREREPEATYWSAVVAYKLSGDREDLIKGWNFLLERFPESEWAQRAGYIRR